MRYVIAKALIAVVTLITFGYDKVIDLKGSKVTLAEGGSGLYQSHAGYVYRGASPNNYILFNNELWRIMSLENDGTIKIVKNESLGNMAFDEENSNDWDRSSLNHYLNNEYKNSIKEKVFDNISLMSMDEYLASNSNVNLCGNLDLYFKNEEACHKTNYLDLMISSVPNRCAWTRSRDVNDRAVLYAGNTYFPDNEARFNLCGVLPVVYLKNSIRLNGKGTKISPFKIER